jgi:hypothetical protein
VRKVAEIEMSQVNDEDGDKARRKHQNKSEDLKGFF